LEAESAKALVHVTLPRLKVLNVADNFDLPKKSLKKKYGDRVKFGDDDDDEEEDEDDGDNEDGMEDLIQQFTLAGI